MQVPDLELVVVQVPRQTVEPVPEDEPESEQVLMLASDVQPTVDASHVLPFGSQLLPDPAQYHQVHHSNAYLSCERYHVLHSYATAGMLSKCILLGRKRSKVRRQQDH